MAIFSQPSQVWSKLGNSSWTPRKWLTKAKPHFFLLPNCSEKFPSASGYVSLRGLFIRRSQNHTRLVSVYHLFCAAIILLYLTESANMNKQIIFHSFQIYSPLKTTEQRTSIMVENNMIGTEAWLVQKGMSLFSFNSDPNASCQYKTCLANANRDLSRSYVMHLWDPREQALELNPNSPNACHCTQLTIPAIYERNCRYSSCGCSLMPGDIPLFSQASQNLSYSCSSYTCPVLYMGVCPEAKPSFASSVRHICELISSLYLVKLK